MFHPKCKKSRVMELLFADDLLVFTKPDAKSLKALRLVLGGFAGDFALHINNSKSAIYLAGVKGGGRAGYLEGYWCPDGELPFKYLGFPLASKRLVHDCKPIMDKITDRKLHCTSKKFSMAGRSQLVNSVIQGMQSY